MSKSTEQPLEKYRALVARVDEFCESVLSRYRKEIRCAPGCDDCCCHLSVFPVEAAAIAEEFLRLGAEDQRRIRELARVFDDESSCPLLSGSLCQLYSARPLLCRTQGYPLLIEEDEGERVDFCPSNFQGLKSLPPNAVLSLEALNVALAAINREYVRKVLGGNDAGRIYLKDLILSL